MVFWLIVVSVSGCLAAFQEPVITLSAPSIELGTEMSVPSERLFEQIDPFQQSGGRAVMVENLIVFVPQYKLVRPRFVDASMLQNSLHGRQLFSLTAGLSLDHRNTCFRFLYETWLQIGVFRC